MIKSISNGYHIHDTLTSGLRLPITSKSYDTIKDTFKSLEVSFTEGTKDKDHKQKAMIPFRDKNNKIYYFWSIKIDKPAQTVDVKYGAIESASWSIMLYRAHDKEHFTSIGLKVSKEKSRNESIEHIVTLTANPTAIMRGDFATDTVSSEGHIDPKLLLTAPFYTLADISSVNLFNEDEWKLIESGDLILRDIEIAFPLKLDTPEYRSLLSHKKADFSQLKSDIVLHFSRIYGTRLSLKGKVLDIGDILDCTFSRYPEDSRLSLSTGFMLNLVDYQKFSLFTLKMYDKVAEMKDKGKKWAPEDKTREDEWEKYLRVDIRIYPKFMKKLAAKLKMVIPENFTINDWIEIEKCKEGKFAPWLLKQCLNIIEFPFLTSTVDEIKNFSKEMENALGKKVAQKWLSSVTYTDTDLGIMTKTQKNNISLFRKARNAPAKIGGLVFNMQNAFNFTSVLEEKDFEQVFDIDDLANTIKSKKPNRTYDVEKMEFRAPIFEFAGYDLTDEEIDYLDGKKVD